MKKSVTTPKLERITYIVLIVLTGLIGLLASWTAVGRQIDNYAYDLSFRLHEPPPWNLGSIVLGIDERTIHEFGNLDGIRRALTRGLELIAPAHPKAVAIDVILAEAYPDDAKLEAAMKLVPRLVLSSDLLPDGRWDDPIPRFKFLAGGIGEVHADLDRYDAVSRAIPLEKVSGHDRRWALSLEAFRLSRNVVITEAPDTLEVAGITIPSRQKDGRLMRIRYVPPSRGGIPAISVAELEAKPQLASSFAGKVVFVGVTDQTAVRDRWMTPYSNGIAMPGVVMHANAFETIANGLFLEDASDSFVVLWCLLLAAAMALIFAYAGGWRANVLAIALLLIAHVAPYFLFTRSIVFPYLPGVACAWLTAVSAAAWRHFVTRRRLVRAEASRDRYQRAMQFVTHEMRTPLTAIQGSSELITRYALPDEKRKEIASTINAESKRLGKMIETFLNVERLSAGQVELKREDFSAPELVGQCVARVQPLAEHKEIAIAVERVPEMSLSGDRELMEYAVYNLLTNAVKYSAPRTCVTISGGRARGELRLSVEDQGIGMDTIEVKRIFEKFYRTKKAEQSGECGSGIGLSIVEQIVAQHGGSIIVDSTPGKGSRFTLVLPVQSS